MRLVLALPLVAALPLQAEDLGLKVPPNFRVTLWADHTLANDIYTMALDEKGRVVVSGPGYIRRLEDTKGTGKADKATNIAETRSGAMGLLFARDHVYAEEFGLFVTSDGRISERRSDDIRNSYFRDEQSPHEFPFSEHGAHALKLGPDGMLYAIIGNDGRLHEIQKDKSSRIRVPEAGGVIRFPWTRLKEVDVDVIAHGFRNPYDFDFTPYGDIITYDSDTERDDGLPWYSPTRVYHVMPGAHHGWRLPGHMRSLARPGYYPDTVDTLADLGRGSPTGVCCYRHTQFPPHYRGGVFLLDWTFGKVYYMPLVPEGSSYRSIKPDIFLEPTGTNGFAPTAARVAPDGSLFISIGGRGTRGGVYRIEYLVNGEAPVIPKSEPDLDLDRVLNAPQPLEAWSMAKWMPLVSELKPADLVRVALDEKESDLRRMRTVDILATEIGYWPDTVNALLESESEFVRLGVARRSAALGERYLPLLWSFAGDKSPRVRVEALLGISYEFQIGKGGKIDGDLLIENLGYRDHRVRLAAARVLTFITDAQRRPIERRIQSYGLPNAVSAMIVAHTSADRAARGLYGDYLHNANVALENAKSPAERIDLYRALMLSLGDWNLTTPKVELFSAYSVPIAPKRDAAYIRLLSHSIVGNILSHFPSNDSRENIEASRLLAMLETDRPEATKKILGQITEGSHPTRDFHYLTVLARLTAKLDANQTAFIADSLIALDKKLAERNVQVKQNWPARLSELVGELLRANPKLHELIALHPDLVQPGNALIAAKLTGENRQKAASRFLTALSDNPEISLTAELINLLTALPAEETLPLFRSRWKERSLRELLVKHLALKPNPADRGKFHEVLEIANGEALNVALGALESLPRDKSPANLVPLFARLRQSFSDPKEAAIRKRLVGLINRQTGQSFAFVEGKPESATLAAEYLPIFKWFEKEHALEAKKLTTAAEDEETIRKMLPTVKWDAGDVDRGAKLYRDRGCQTCHGGTTRIGVDLAGVSKRLSRDDLLTAIVNSSRDVAPAYRVSNIDLKDGKRVSGIVVYESTETLIVQTGAGETKRISGTDIESRLPSSKSLMPDGLLKGLKPAELADLFAFLAKQ